MRASIVYFVFTSLVNGPITFAFPSAMNSMITVKPSKKSITMKSKSNINDKVSSSTVEPSVISSWSPVSGSSLPSSYHSTVSPGIFYSTPTYSTSNSRQQTIDGFLSTSTSTFSDRSNNSSLPLTSRNSERKKKKVTSPMKGVSLNDNSGLERGSENKMTTMSINQWTDHVNATNRGETNSLLSRVKRRGARGGGFGNAGRKGPRDRLDYRKNNIITMKPSLWPLILVTVSTILIVFKT